MATIQAKQARIIRAPLCSMRLSGRTPARAGARPWPCTAQAFLLYEHRERLASPVC
ncbi:hypothetical protein QJS66_06200 [Kocuria rhizophila]|nr:hypothetical protein QJS66_06200 [Kocuria rhizophila]